MSTPHLVPGQTVETTSPDGEVRYGVYLGLRDGYAQIAYPTANVPLEDITTAWTINAGAAA